MLILFKTKLGEYFLSTCISRKSQKISRKSCEVNYQFVTIPCFVGNCNQDYLICSLLHKKYHRI